MAIIALIVTPLVMTIIRKARISADKRSIDAYGRSIELAIAGYLLDNGSFPTSIDQLTIEYSGDEVVCTTTKLNSDSSVYLADCTVGGRSVDYTYGKEESVPTYQAYEIGDEVNYNNVAYRVIKDSSESEKTVTLLKAEPLTVAEVNQYGAGHVNRYTSSSQGTAYDYNGYGGMAYYTSETCGKVNGSLVYSGCTTDYAQSEVKYAVDAWKIDKAPAASEARLITYDELLDNLGYENSVNCTAGCYYSGSLDNVPSWVYGNYWYWTMSQNGDQASSVWHVRIDGDLDGDVRVYDYGGPGRYGHVVRPVITVSKTVLE